ncbi:MAG TPA: DnaJ C-terminal domain-containing protein [Candidatus Saccharimonadales bacterium]|nr:DnaJ C-terminal domain-containing protein [Candidatus Saccharimonadales bacterium]
MATDYYSTLGISKSASADEIKKAYRKQALEWHPDKHATDKEIAEKKFKEINEAYQVLSNPQKKATYDQVGHEAFSQGGGRGNPFAGGQGSPFSYSYSTNGGGNPFGDFGDPFDIFAQFFGMGRQQQKPRYSLTIDFMDAMKGVSKNIEINGKRRTIKIPAGVDTGNTIDFGDFRVSVQVRPHKTFERDGDDILVKATIPFSMAALGGEIKVPTIDEEVKIKIKAGTQNGSMLRLKDQGVSRVSGRGRGDEYVRIIVETPGRLNRNQKKILEQMREEGL